MDGMKKAETVGGESLEIKRGRVSEIVTQMYKAMEDSIDNAKPEDPPFDKYYVSSYVGQHARLSALIEKKSGGIYGNSELDEFVTTLWQFRKFAVELLKQEVIVEKIMKYMQS